MTRDVRRTALRNAARCLLPVAATVCALTIAPRLAAAAAFDVGDTTWEGCSELLDIVRAELGAARVQPVGILNWEEVTSDDGVLVLHPLQAMDADESTAFMKAGGRLAILDDYGAGEETLKRFRIERIPTPSRPVAALRNRAALAIAEPVVDLAGGHNSGPHPVVANVQRLVTNHATGLRHPNLSPVLKIRAIGEPDVVIAVAGQVEKGRLFAMSDPSAVINQMLRYPGNRAFLAGLARYLVDDDGGRRQRGRLFIVANRFREEGAYGGQTALRKDLESELHSIAGAIAEYRREGLPRWGHVLLAALGCLGLALWVARRSARPYRSPLPRYARPTPLVSQGGAAGRFALLAAPTSPAALALLELKSALFEAVAQRFNLDLEPSADVLLRHVRRAGWLDDEAYSAFKRMLVTMQRVEASVVAGRPVRVGRELLDKAASVVGPALEACRREAGQIHRPSAEAPRAATAEGPDPTSNGGASRSDSPGARKGSL